MRKPKQKKVSSKKIGIAIAVWIVLVGGSLGFVLYNGTLLGALDSNVEYISAAELATGKRPTARHVHVKDGLLDQRGIELTTSGSGRVTDHDYYYAVHDAAEGEESVVHLIIHSDDSMLNPQGTYGGHLSYTEDGFEVESWIKSSFKEGNIKLADRLIWMEEGKSQHTDMLFAIIVLLSALAVSIGFTYFYLVDDIRAVKKQKANPLPEIPPVTESQEALEKQVAALLRQYAPEDKEESVSIWANWRNFRDPVTGEWDKGGTMNPVPQPLLEVLTKLVYYFYHKGIKDRDSLHFSLDYDEDREKWAVTKFYD